MLQQKVNSLRDELFQLDKIVSESKQLNESFVKESQRRFKEIDGNIQSILMQITGKDDADVQS